MTVMLANCLWPCLTDITLRMHFTIWSCDDNLSKFAPSPKGNTQFEYKMQKQKRNTRKKLGKKNWFTRKAGTTRACPSREASRGKRLLFACTAPTRIRPAPSAPCSRSPAEESRSRRPPGEPGHGTWGRSGGPCTLHVKIMSGLYSKA